MNSLFLFIYKTRVEVAPKDVTRPVKEKDSASRVHPAFAFAIFFPDSFDHNSNEPLLVASQLPIYFSSNTTVHCSFWGAK